ncbi:MAG: type II toxin-antitoxin system Phd/YefM family antitoxin [bacterium]|nr:type II toxin-antitoxin system Phd/YefM family antitoxin [bacterium]
MLMQISKSQFKPKSLEYFRQVQETGEPIIITDRGKPVLKIIPYTVSPDELLKALRGSVMKYEDPLEPVGVEDWEGLQ